MAEASAELQEFAELTEVPVYCTMPGKSGFDERHPLALGSGSAPPAGRPASGCKSLTSSWPWARA